MPTYEYRCAEGHATERRVRSYDLVAIDCPACGSEAQRAPAYSSVGVSGYAIQPMSERPLPLSRYMEALDDWQTSNRKAGVVDPPDPLDAAKAQARKIATSSPELVSGT